MNLQGVHLIISHHLDELAQIVHGDVFAADIDHETAYGIGRTIGGDAARQGVRAGLFADLQNGAGAPKCALGRGGGDGCSFTYGQAVTFVAKGVAAIGTCQNDVAGATFALHDAESARKKFGIVGSKALGNGEESAVTHHNAAGGMKFATGTLPRSEFGHNKGTGIANCRSGMCPGRGETCHEK